MIPLYLYSTIPHLSSSIFRSAVCAAQAKVRLNGLHPTYRTRGSDEIHHENIITRIDCLTLHSTKPTRADKSIDPWKAKPSSYSLKPWSSLLRSIFFYRWQCRQKHSSCKRARTCRMEICRPSIPRQESLSHPTMDPDNPQYCTCRRHHHHHHLKMKIM